MQFLRGSGILYQLKYALYRYACRFPAEIQEPTITAPVVFPKERVLTFRRYADRRDLLSVLLEDGKEYTFDQIDGLINDFMKGKVK